MVVINKSTPLVIGAMLEVYTETLAAFAMINSSNAAMAF